jgi:hypothetical protein
MTERCDRASPNFAQYYFLAAAQMLARIASYELRQTR